MTTLEQDLKTRWQPTSEQVEQAEVALAAHPEVRFVFTTHLLLNKFDGFWTDDIVVEPLPGVWTEREKALAFVVEASKARFIQTGQRLVGGWTMHSKNGWGVFEDVLSIHGQEV